MALRHARPIDEVIEIAGEDYDSDYDDLGGREERIKRRKKLDRLAGSAAPKFPKSNSTTEVVEGGVRS